MNNGYNATAREKRDSGFSAPWKPCFDFAIYGATQLDILWKTMVSKDPYEVFRG